MKSPRLVTAVLAGGVACGTAAATSFLLQPARGERALAAPPGAARALDATETSGDTELLALLDAQARELEMLRARVAQLENRPAVVARAPVERLEVAADEGPAAALASPSPGEAPDATFVASVDAALQQIREEERRESEARRYEEQLDKIDQRMERLAERLGLSGYQVDELSTLFLKQAASNYELRLARGEFDDDSLYKERRKTLEKETRAALATILTPEQLKDYQRSEKKKKDRVVTPGDLKRLQDARTAQKRR